MESVFYGTPVCDVRYSWLLSDRWWTVRNLSKVRPELKLNAKLGTAAGRYLLSPFHSTTSLWMVVRDFYESFYCHQTIIIIIICALFLPRLVFNPWLHRWCNIRKLSVADFISFLDWSVRNLKLRFLSFRCSSFQQNVIRVFFGPSKLKPFVLSRQSRKGSRKCCLNTSIDLKWSNMHQLEKNVYFIRWPDLVCGS